MQGVQRPGDEPGQVSRQVADAPVGDPWMMLAIPVHRLGQVVPFLLGGHSLIAQDSDADTDHFCAPRTDKAQAFFEEILVRTKGLYARKQFVLEDWQRDDTNRTVFDHCECSGDVTIFGVSKN